MSDYSPRIVSPELSCLQAEEFDGSRWRLLTDLNFALEDDEATAETLLKAFDLSLDDCDPKLSTFDVHVPAQVELAQDSFTLPPSTSQNPFLSTPMRLKHFSRLSPSILRVLLRSPSLRSPSLCDDSLDSAPESLGSPLLRWRPDNLHAPSDSDLQSRQASLPLTPPPTGRIPFSTQLPNPDSAKPCNGIDLRNAAVFVSILGYSFTYLCSDSTPQLRPWNIQHLPPYATQLARLPVSCSKFPASD
jgi:hypothetical protein